MICKHCGKKNDDSCLYCIQCGMKITADESSGVKKFCSKCGKENTNKSTFCENCGTSLKEVDKSSDVVYAYDEVESHVYATNMIQAPPSKTPMTLAIVSLCLNLLCCCIPILPQIAVFILSIISIVKSAKQMKTNDPGNSKVSLMLSIIAIVIAVFIVIYMIYFLAITLNDPLFWEQYEEIMNQFESQY